MIVDYKQHYDADYFTGKKTYRDVSGREHLYHGPALKWEGFQFVADALAPLVPGKSILDIGCSGGDLASRFLDKGYDAYGVDISQYAIDNCVEKMRGRVAVADVTTCPELLENFPKTYDAVIATDLLEHIYEEDLDKTFQWMLDKTNRWMFFCVATAQNTSSPLFVPNKLEFVHKKGAPIPPEFEATAVSGHVNVRSFKYWIKKFLSFDLKIRWDLGYLLQVQRETNPAWRDTSGWNMQTTWILEKC